MRNTIVLFIVFCSINSFAQDTVWFDKQFRRVDKRLADSFEARKWQPDSACFEISEFSLKKGIQLKYQVVDTLGKVKNGYYVSYFEDGTKSYQMNYRENKKEGTLYGYWPNGLIRRVDIYRQDSLISGTCYGQKGQDTAYFPYMIYPKFKNGKIEEFTAFLQQNLKYPAKARRKGIEGKIYVNLVVEKDGSLSNVVVQNKGNSMLENEALRVVKLSSGQWQAAIMEGEKVRMLYTVPINFKLQ